MISEAIFFGFIFSLINANYVDIRELSSSKLGKRSHVYCLTIGKKYCESDCKSIGMCLQGREQTIFICPSGTYCNDDNGSPICSDKVGMKCFMGPHSCRFKCADNGFYQDPIFCERYHFCYPNDFSGAEYPLHNGVSDPSTIYTYFTDSCINGTIFNPLLGTCELFPGWCEGFPIPLCKYPGEIFQVGGPKYAVCQQYSTDEGVLYPFQYRCRTNTYPCTDDY